VNKREGVKEIMPKKILILGAGPGGYVAAIRAAQLGAKVTVIEEENIGGTCLNWGCIPSKIMITSARLLDKLRKIEEYGIKVDGRVYPDMQLLMARKEKVIKDQAEGIIRLFDHHKVRFLRGRGYINSFGKAIVNIWDGDISEVSWDKLIVATGTQPFGLPSFPFDGKLILSSNHALCLQEIPKSIMIVGGGVIGCEFAFIFSLLGSKVILVETLDRLLPLPTVDEDCSKIIHREMKKRKIKVMVKSTAEMMEKKGDKVRVVIGPSPSLLNSKEKANKYENFEVDKILVSIGRMANTTDLGLDNIGVRLDERGWIHVNDKMETNVPGVYAIGDVLGPSKIMLAHVASAEGLVAVENAMGASRTMAYNVVPGAIFTLPEVANVGLSENQAKAMGYMVRADSVLFRTIGKSQVIGEIAGEAKIVSDSVNKKILGVHIVGPNATDLIAEAAVVMQMGGTVRDIAETIHAHPTLAEILAEASLKSLEKSYHL
jgi:dihydrolipoamide dehydrogenase